MRTRLSNRSFHDDSIPPLFYFGVYSLVTAMLGTPLWWWISLMIGNAIISAILTIVIWLIMLFVGYKIFVKILTRKDIR